MVNNHNQITKPIMDEIKEVDSNIVSYEQALEHFKDYFNKQQKSSSQKNHKLSNIDNKELN